MRIERISDDFLINLYREGQQIAIDLLYERYTSYIYGFINSQAQINHLFCDYNELFQEIMLTFISCIEKYDEHNGCFYYFVKCAVDRRLHYLMAKIKKNNKIIPLDIVVYDNNDAISVIDFVSEDSNNLYYEKELYDMIVGPLNEKDKKIIDMKISGYSYGEISTAIGETKQFVYRKINKLKNIIKDIIEKID